MNSWQPQDEEYETRVRESFARQRVMQLIGARLERVEYGWVDIILPYRARMKGRLSEFSRHNVKPA